MTSIAHLHVDLPDAPERLEPVGLAEPHADEDGAGALALELGQRFVEVVRARDGEPLAAEVLGEQLARGGIVVDDENSAARVSHSLSRPPGSARGP